MDKQTGMIVTVIVAVLTLCCSAACCAGGLLIALNEQLELRWDIEPAVGGAPCCLSILVWVIPVLLWFFLVRGKNGSVESDLSAENYTPEYIEGDFEEEDLTE